MAEKIYISGPITNDPQYIPKFKAAKEKLSAQGFEVLSPAEIISPDPYRTWEDYMAQAIFIMLQADRVYMLNNWKRSTGARLEHELAILLGKLTMYQEYEA